MSRVAFRATGSYPSASYAGYPGYGSYPYGYGYGSYPYGSGFGYGSGVSGSVSSNPWGAGWPGTGTGYPGSGAGYPIATDPGSAGGSTGRVCIMIYPPPPGC